MHGTHSRASFLALVINMEAAKIDTSFLASKLLDTCLSSVFIYYSCNM